jgi:hypothetical protein
MQLIVQLLRIQNTVTLKSMSAIYFLADSLADDRCPVVYCICVDLIQLNIKFFCIYFQGYLLNCAVSSSPFGLFHTLCCSRSFFYDCLPRLWSAIGCFEIWLSRLVDLRLKVRHYVSLTSISP